MAYRIIASDLDGTLFDSHGRVSNQNLAAIETLYKMGIHFVPASGRAYREMPSILRDHPLIRYYITSDGGTVYDKKTDTTHLLTMPREVSNRVLDKMYEYPVNMMLHADVNSYVDAELNNDYDYKRCNYSDLWRDFVYKNDLPKENFKDFAYSHEAVQVFCTFFENLADLEECKRYFDKMDGVLCAQSDKYNIEVFSDKAGKGNALFLLADILGIDRRDTIAVGDSTNDMTMVSQAGLGLAMDNAVDELKEKADAVICNNDGHSVKYILERYIK